MKLKENKKSNESFLLYQSYREHRKTRDRNNYKNIDNNDTILFGDQQICR